MTRRKVLALAHGRRGTVRPIATAAFVVAGFAGCGGDSGPAERPSVNDGLPAAVACHAQYRPDAETMVGAEEQGVTVERPASPGSNRAAVSFVDLRLEVTYDNGPDGRSVSVVVAGPSAGDEMERVLYQMPADTVPTFAGGHGFTGLHYLSVGAAQLQWWCTASS